MKSNGKSFKIGYKLLAIIFWISIWEIISRIVGQKILIVPPRDVLKTLISLLSEGIFWKTILFSSGRIILGFLLALFFGILLSILSYISKLFSEIVSPIMKVIKATPVASFIILALIWFPPKNLSILISFLMVMPMVYSNVLQGLRHADRRLLQMTQIFRVKFIRKVTAVYIPSVASYLVSAISVGLGFSWKAGIAAEVIGIPSGSIGERLYEAKLYLMTKELFAWTIVIILISFLFEKVVLGALEKLSNRYKS